MIAAAFASLLAWFEHVPTAAWIYGWFAVAVMVLLVVSAMVAGARADERGAELTTRRREWDRMDR